MFSKRNFFYDYVAAVTGVALVTALYRFIILEVNSTTIALSYLLVVLIVSSARGLAAGVAASLVSMFCFNFFFLPPVGTLTIADPQNWVALFAFVVTAIITSQLSAAARLRASEAEQRREELLKLFQISQSIIVNPDPEKVVPSLARRIVVEFAADYCAIFEGEDGKLTSTGTAVGDEEPDFEPSLSLIRESFQSGDILVSQRQLKSKGGSSFPGSNPAQTTKTLAYATLKIGMKPIGVLVLLASRLEHGTIEAIAGLVALALERAKFLQEVSRTEALRQSDELKSALLASVSHDLRTPLTSMRAAIESLLERDARWDQEALREFHLIINEDVQRLTTLVQNLLQMARIEAGELRLEKAWTAVTEIIANVLERCHGMLENHPVTIEADEPLPLVKVDALLIAQALSHLVENAAKYSPAESEIMIRGCVTNNRLTISVEDRGIGIAQEELVHIFDKFYRGSASRVGERSGTGMGLSIVRGIIEAHGGEISVESAFGRGSTFRFSIPVEVKKFSPAAVLQEKLG